MFVNDNIVIYINVKNDEKIIKSMKKKKIVTNNDTLPFESDEYTQEWCEVRLIANEKETNGVLTNGRNHT